MLSRISHLPSALFYTLSHYTYSLTSTLAYYTDTTVTKVLPGLILDAFFFKNSSPKSLKKLAEWGKAKGCKDLKHFQDLQYKRWYFYPFEYVKTTFITTARKTYYSAASQNAKQKSVTDLVKEVRNLAIKHLEVSEADDGLSLDTFEDSITKIIKGNQKEPSYWKATWNLYSRYPNTRVGHYTAWALRLGIFYYLSPSDSRMISAALTATGIYFWSILLTPGARIDLANIKAPEKAENELPEKAQNAILSSAPETFQKQRNDNFENAVRKLKMQVPIEDPFTIIKDEKYYEKEFHRLKQLRENEKRGTPSWYALDWDLRTSLIGIYNCRLKDPQKQEQERLRKDNWVNWHKSDSKGALVFIKSQTDVPKKIWSEWIPKKKKTKILKTDD
ncbi:MAG: hypothetical protein K1000chlam3_00194 [Chlamydiae bacterium]|nr:hypothetical protein [Chlamydiota bacterium]